MEMESSENRGDVAEKSNHYTISKIYCRRSDSLTHYLHTSTSCAPTDDVRRSLICYFAKRFMIMLEFHFYDDFDDDKLFDESKCAKLCTVTAEKIIECIV